MLNYFTEVILSLTGVVVFFIPFVLNPISFCCRLISPQGSVKLRLFHTQYLLDALILGTFHFRERVRFFM